MSADSPFIPGARVAISSRYNDRIDEGFVEKVYKTGNFTLRGSSQQWRPSGPTNYSPWSARTTGGGGFRSSYLKIWNAETDLEIREAVAKSNRETKWRELRDKFKGLGTDDLTDEMLNQIDAALNRGTADAAHGVDGEQAEVSKP